jgi:hypothetical protein
MVRQRASGSSGSDLMAFLIENNGPEILSSNFWDSDKANFFLSINDGAARLLIPDSRIDEIRKMITGKLVILSRGPCWPQSNKDAIEIRFDDGSKTPYSIQLTTEQTDDLVPSSIHGRNLTFSAWGKNAIKIFERPARFRMVKRLPCLEAWNDQIQQEEAKAKRWWQFWKWE